MKNNLSLWVIKTSTVVEVALANDVAPEANVVFASWGDLLQK